MSRRATSAATAATPPPDLAELEVAGVLALCTH